MGAVGPEVCTEGGAVGSGKDSEVPAVCIEGSSEECRIDSRMTAIVPEVPEMTEMT